MAMSERFYRALNSMGQNKDLRFNGSFTEDAGKFIDLFESFFIDSRGYTPGERVYLLKAAQFNLAKEWLITEHETILAKDPSDVTEADFEQVWGDFKSMY